jgi:uncharacterized membrane protein YphA (DoxX/SURF4 family)
MHPLSSFPQLLFLSLLAPTILRLSVGFFILHLGKNRSQSKHNRASPIYFISGVLLIIGLYTQIASIVGILVLIFDFYVNRKSTLISEDKKTLYVIVGVILLSLLFTGPGLFAFDLPL